MWWSGAGPLATGPAITEDGSISGEPHFAEPLTVVRDDADALVAWLAVGTPVLRAAQADGRVKRDDRSTRFTAETVQDVGVWADCDVLRVAPTGRPWTVWVMFAERTGEFAGWYVNLEAPHVRDGRSPDCQARGPEALRNLDPPAGDASGTDPEDQVSHPTRPWLQVA